MVSFSDSLWMTVEMLMSILVNNQQLTAELRWMSCTVQINTEFELSLVEFSVRHIADTQLLILLILDIWLWCWYSAEFEQWTGCCAIDNWCTFVCHGYETPPLPSLGTSDMWCWSGGRGIFKKNVSVLLACVGPGHCCYRIGPIHFLARWRKRHSWTRVSLVSLGLVV